MNYLFAKPTGQVIKDNEHSHLEAIKIAVKGGRVIFISYGISSYQADQRCRVEFQETLRQLREIYTIYLDGWKVQINSFTHERTNGLILFKSINNIDSVRGIEFDLVVEA